MEAMQAQMPKIETEMRGPNGPARLVLVARAANGGHSGFVWIEEARSGMTGDAFAFVAELFVEEAYRRRGLGRRLLEEGEAWARERGVRRLVLNVAVGNAPARSLYEAVGYGVETVRMGKEIAG